MKKIIIIALIILMIIVIILFMPINNGNIIIKKGDILFGKSRGCTEIEVMTDDMTNRKCLLCNKKFLGSSSQKICSDCSNITNRCSVCGGIEKKK